MVLKLSVRQKKRAGSDRCSPPKFKPRHNSGQLAGS